MVIAWLLHLLFAAVILIVWLALAVIIGFFVVMAFWLLGAAIWLWAGDIQRWYLPRHPKPIVRRETRLMRWRASGRARAVLIPRLEDENRRLAPWVADSNEDW